MNELDINLTQLSIYKIKKIAISVTKNTEMQEITDNYYIKQIPTCLSINPHVSYSSLL